MSITDVLVFKLARHSEKCVSRIRFCPLCLRRVASQFKLRGLLICGCVRTRNVRWKIASSPSPPSSQERNEASLPVMKKKNCKLSSEMKAVFPDTKHAEFREAVIHSLFVFCYFRLTWLLSNTLINEQARIQGMARVGPGIPKINNNEFDFK